MDISAHKTRGNGDFLSDESSPYMVTTYDGAEINLSSLISDTTLPSQTLILAGDDIKEHYLKPVISPHYDLVYRYTTSHWPQ